MLNKKELLDELKEVSPFWLIKELETDLIDITEAETEEEQQDELVTTCERLYTQIYYLKRIREVLYSKIKD